MSRYSIGIDLGTTNCILAYVDHESEDQTPKTLPIPQVVASGEVGEKPFLPSCIYLPNKIESKPAMLSLPWLPKGQDFAIGYYAREMAARSPNKVVTSAKSWLCCDKIDRHSNVLPLGNEDDDNARLISPVEATRLILDHLRNAWNSAMAIENPQLKIENQDVVITVPASFDAVARELTVEAAQALGLTFTLLEEPQAAFYAWLSNNDKTWRKQVKANDIILVCDIGGGTSDFSLISVVDTNGDMSLERLAVGDHTLLGGDNMDLTLAYYVSQKLKAEKNIVLNRRQFNSLTHACRKAKESLAAGNETEQPLTIFGSGSGLVSGTIKTKISYDDLKSAILDGFFPVCEITDIPATSLRGGIRTISLDYASDPAFTKHLAAFLARHCPHDENGDLILPGIILFNGGVCNSQLFRDRILDVLKNWKPAGDNMINILTETSCDTSVAIGAAWYSHIRLTGGIRIKAGSSRSYYIGIESSMPAIPGIPIPMEALCVVNFGMEEGSSAKINEKGLGLIVGEPTVFRVFSSTSRPEDKVGQRFELDTDTDITEMPSLDITLPVPDGEEEAKAKLVPIRLRTVLTEIGTMEVWCDAANNENSWKLVFNVRGEE